MIIRILTIGDRMPAWVETGYNEFAKRFTTPFSLSLIEIPAEKRGKNADIARIIEHEGNKLIAAINPKSRVVALDVKGESWSTEALTMKLKTWQTEGAHLDLLIGGPDGLSQNCLQKAQTRWSLSPLTLPHPLVRIVLAEQLYRATTILKNHPYHRG
ncbi:MAG: 23S rRNA (pseudouridine(1915)-N(3))-methyltransferase RlmH [Gammaproteobacteria bacterium]|nr:23S rRNA (pseudouridine(1915)-N(3))-methyltransferase RlmH [Gammaproteobacteria bacterium]